MIELIGQIFCRPQIVNRVAHRPMLWRDHHLALHQAARRAFGIGQRLLHRHPVGHLKRVKDLFLPFRFQILKDINDIIGVERANRLGHHRIGQGVDHLFADRPIQFRQHIAINPPRPKRQKCAAVMGVDLFQKVGDVGGMQRGHQPGQPAYVTCFHGMQNRGHAVGVHLILVHDGQILVHRRTPAFQCLAKLFSAKQGGI